MESIEQLHQARYAGSLPVSDSTLGLKDEGHASIAANCLKAALAAARRDCYSPRPFRP